jgi:hypothetical protein
VFIPKMKSASLTLAALVGTATAMDTAAPVISLSMAERNPFLMKIDTIHRVDNGGLADSGATGSSQDYTMTVPAGVYSGATRPALPVAQAYDHHDGSIPVETRVFKMTNAATYGDTLDGCGDSPAEKICPTAAVVTAQHGTIYQHTQDCIDYDNKGTYLIKYDSKDRSGNQAHQLVFGLVLDDKIKPIITLCQTAPRTIEAGSYDPVCTSTTIADNLADTAAEQAALDATLRFSIKYSSVSTGGTSVEECPVAGCTQSQINTKIDTLKQGYFLVTARGNDQACIYGDNNDNNDAIRPSFTVSVFDTRAPQIEVLGSDPHQHECNYVYTDQGTSATDVYDDIVGNALSTVATWGGSTGAIAAGGDVATVGSATLQIRGPYQMNYNLVDATGNTAIQKTRTINVVDTEKPTIALVGNSLVIHYSDSTSNPTGSTDGPVEEGYTCVDWCDPAPTVAYAWGNLEDGTGAAGADADLSTAAITFDDRKLGDYYRYYTCTDHSGNIDTVTRTFRVQDNEGCTITPQGACAVGVETVEADRDASYEPSTATVHDYVDGDINEALKISGDVVNLRVPGTYTYNFDAKDKSGNSCPQVTCQVEVVDTSAPTCTVLGTQVLQLEAGFTYTDAGAIATDDLDGEIGMCDSDNVTPVATAGHRASTCIRKVGDTVDVSRSFYSAASCEEIKLANPNAPTGTYYITTGAGHDIASFSRTAVNCNMAGTGSTWQLVTGSISYAHGTGVCPAGMTAFTGGKCDFPWVTTADETMYKDRVCYDNAGATNGIMHSETAAPGSASTIVKDTAYLCVSAGADQSRQVFNSALTSNTHSNHFNTITQAEVGKYIIRYSSEDHASNAMPCCYRTVVVRDTLPPVISLHRVSDGKILMKGDGVSSATNPAWGVANPNLASGDYLMAESAQTSSVNGWIIGAVASGVTGLALVAYATKL